MSAVSGGLSLRQRTGPVLLRPYQRAEVRRGVQDVVDPASGAGSSTYRMVCPVGAVESEYDHLFTRSS